MDVRAVLLLGEPESNYCHTAESIAGMPIALLPVLGQPVVHQVAENLRAAGIDQIRVIGNACSASHSMERHAHHSGLEWIRTPGETFWKAAEDSIVEFGQQGADLVVLIRLGAYLEFDVDELLQFHLDSKAPVTRVQGAKGDYDYFVVSTSRRSDAAFLLRHHLQQSRMPAPRFTRVTYENPLLDSGSLRRLVQDSFSLKTRISPHGREIRPGVWAGPGAKIERGARVVAPAYIGERAVVRAAALITRGSSIEHHAEVDCGTIIEASSVLPFSFVGAGLEVRESTVAFRQLTNHRTQVTIEVLDPVLLDVVPSRGLSGIGNRIASLWKFLIRPDGHAAGREPTDRMSPWAAPGRMSPALRSEMSRSELLRIYEGE